MHYTPSKDRIDVPKVVRFSGSVRYCPGEFSSSGERPGSSSGRSSLAPTLCAASSRIRFVSVCAFRYRADCHAKTRTQNVIGDLFQILLNAYKGCRDLIAGPSACCRHGSCERALTPDHLLLCRCMFRGMDYSSG